ncbi:hypothetical protein [Kaarinaea lacus]
MKRSIHFLLPGLVALLASPHSALANQWSGYVSAEYRYFMHEAAYSDQHDNNASLSAQPEYYTNWDDGQQSFTFVPFARWDQNDKERSHTDIRELTWLMATDSWELRAGIRKVFWGVTESQHLVDIINQTDLVEALDGEEKLGQPMVNFALKNDWGTVDLYVLPLFRERTFPGPDGRLRFALPVDTDHPVYESSQEERHIDYAARWSHYIGSWDIGISYFNGTSRDPRLVPNIDFSALIPVYDLIEQWGLDLQATLDNWLWKMEVISRSGQDESYIAMTGGFEYTFVGIMESQADLGVIAEVMYDDRGDDATTPFADDVMIGGRFTLNDEQSTELLLGIIFDNNDSARMLRLESSRRIGNNWKVILEGQAFINIPSDDALAGFKDDDYLQLEVVRYF